MFKILKFGPFFYSSAEQKSNLDHQIYSKGPLPTAKWSKQLPVTAHCLLSLPGLESWPGDVRKLGYLGLCSCVLKIQEWQLGGYVQ